MDQLTPMGVRWQRYKECGCYPGGKERRPSSIPGSLGYYSHQDSLHNTKMKGTQSAIVAVAALTRCVAGHAFFQQAGSGSTDFGTTCVRMPVSFCLKSFTHVRY